MTKSTGQIGEGWSIATAVAVLVPVLLFQQPVVLSKATAGQAAPGAAAMSQPRQNAPIEIPPAPKANAGQSNCPILKDQYLPVDKTIEARVTNFLDSESLKPGKKIWANSLFEEFDPQCHLMKDSVIYGRVTAAFSSKKPARSELGLQFDRVDCFGQPARAMKLTLIAVIAPDSSRSETVHDALPGQGGGVDNGWPGWDQRLDPGGPPNFVHPGELVGFDKLSLEPRGGPECSALLKSPDRSIVLGSGTVLILAELDTP